MTEYNDPLPSKTRRKLEMQELQEVGLELMALKAGQQARLPLNDPLRAALDEARRIQHPDARRRHALYVGRLISDSDPDTLLAALAALTDPVVATARRIRRSSQLVLCVIAHQPADFSELLNDFSQGNLCLSSTGPQMEEPR